MCTHAPLHATIAIPAVKRGVNVLCEKQLYIDLESADHMLAICTEAGVELAISHQFRFTPIFRCAKQWIDSGKIGKLCSFREVGVRTRSRV
ncbi:TPA: hypothetical protein EYN98_15760 [Candidatus Poribacteria bacterium]|nr:hypothetical protein [Candidatus Poribacteria bacterium]